MPNNSEMARREQVQNVPVSSNTTKPDSTPAIYDANKMLSNYQNVIPYSCLYLDLDWEDLVYAIKECLTLVHSTTEDEVIENIKKIWITHQNPNPVLTCLSVRTGLDLYLQAKNFPHGSEIIISAVTIPDIPRILHHHGLQIISLDIDIETTAPKIELLEELITERTVAILLAHIYGKVFDLSPFVNVAKKYNIAIIEDAAEGFCGFDYLGHPAVDISLFSFGTIKYCSSLGGAIAKIRDLADYEKMKRLQETYPSQTSNEYLQKVLKCCILFLFLDCPAIVKPALFILQQLSCDYKRNVTKLVRSFPNNLIERIRFQPSMALLLVMLHRFQSFRPSQITICRLKGEYISSRLPNTVTVVGQKAPLNCYWLFPIIVENPDVVMHRLNTLGIEAHRTSTQLTFIDSDKPPECTTTGAMPYYPHEANYMMNHTVYLPVNKQVPFHVLDKICDAVKYVTKKENKNSLPSIQPKIVSKL